MPFSQEQSAIVAKWIQEKWKEPRLCPVCGEEHWSLADDVFEIRPFDNGILTLGTRGIYPVIIFTCGTCGYALSVNALAIGVLKLPEREEATAP